MKQYDGWFVTRPWSSPTLLLLLLGSLIALLAACAAPPTPDQPTEAPPAVADTVTDNSAELLSNTWRLTSINGEPVPAHVRTTLEFDTSNNSIGGTGGCNRYFGSFTLDGNALTFGGIGSTMMACADPDVDQTERDYFMTLDQTASYSLSEGTLSLMDASGTVILTFVVEEPLSLTATEWQVIAINNGNEAVVSTLPDVPVTMNFGEDGSVSGQASCNNFTGTYTAEQNSMSFGPLATTMMMCEEEVMAQEAAFLAALANVTNFRQDGQTLTLFDANGARQVELVAMSETETAEATTPVVSSDVSSDELFSTLWVLDNINGDVVPAEVRITLQFDAATSGFSGSGGCNNYFGTFTLEGENLSFGEGIGSTMMACGEPAMSTEAAYFDALPRVTRYHLNEGTLILLDADSNKLLTFNADTPPTLAGSSWDVLMYNNGREAVVGTLADAPISLTFGEDGTVFGNASCNNFNGGYTIEGDTIAIGPLATTRMMCAEEVMAQEAAFLAALENATTFSQEGDRLSLFDANGARQVDAVLSAGASSTSKEEPPFLLTNWVLGAYRGEPITAVSPTILFTSDQFSGNAGCNTFFGSYTMDGQSLNISPNIGSTMMMCPDPQMQIEQLFLTSLPLATSYQIENGLLHLLDADGDVLLSFYVEGATENPIVADEVGVMPTVDLADVAFNTAVLGNQLGGDIVPRTPYDASMPPGPVGAPTHLQFTANGTPFMRIYPIKPYMAMWDAAGDPTISQTVARLEEVLASKPLSLDNNPPILPPANGYPDIVGQVRYFDFANGAGSGVRYLARFAQDANPLLNDQLSYYYQGLTADGRYYLAVNVPLVVAGLPADMSEITSEELDAIMADYEAYLAEMTSFVNNLAPTDSTPSLTELDGVISAMSLGAEAETGLGNGGILPAIAGLSETNFTVDLTGFAQWYFWQIVGPYAYNPNTPPMLNGFPRHALVLFDGEPVASEAFIPQERQMRFIPVEEYKALYTGEQWTELDERLNQLQAILAERPDPATLAGQIPLLPEVSGIPVMQANIAYVDSAQFQGIRYLTALKFDVSPVTQAELMYIYTGLSADGQFLMSFSAPVTTAVLPASNSDITPEELDALNANFDQYRADLVTELNAATDFAPSLATLDNVVSSVSISR
jgi:heat shock protein HslJ